MHSPGVKSPIVQLIKERKGLIGRFLQGDTSRFFAHHAEILDDYFRESFAASSIGPQIQVEKNPYAIVALGGYGRKEQCIHSDVDVMLLFKKRIPDQAKQLVQEIIYPLWDTGIDVSHATRSVKECTSLASQDFEVLTSLIDGRFICGISLLYSDLAERLREKVLQRQARAYVDWLCDKNQERHNRFGDSTYLLEPNLKEGMGGLRDFHAMLWAGRASYDITEPRDLEFFGHLSHEEFVSLTHALRFVRNARNWLHHLSRRKCDQLYFEYQIKMAEALGFQSGNGQEPVEKFLGALHKQMEFLKRQHLIFLSGAMRKRKKFSIKNRRKRALSTGIELVNNALDFESPEAIVRRPHVLIKIFEKSAMLIKPLSVSASRLVREFLFLVDAKFQSSKGVLKAFRHILSASPQSFNVLNEMLNTGMLVALIPEMQGIVDRVQYDEYHLYPVDKHLLRTVQILKELRDAAPDSDDAFYAKLYSEVRNPELLLWAGLLHDAGKGGQEPDHGHHAQRGAAIVKPLFERMGFCRKDIEAIAFLVREHLFLIHTATRRDINDETIIIRCARRLQNDDHLKMLYLLTVADSKATGPKAWNDWKAALLKELFFKILRIMRAGELGTPAAADVAGEKRKEVLRLASSMSKQDLENLFEQLPPRYLLYTPAQEIVRHIALYSNLGQGPSVLEAKVYPGTDSRTVTVCARDFPGIFSKIAGVFTLNNLDILSAQIYTWRNQIALDIFHVKPPADRIHEEKTWQRVDSDLKAVLNGKTVLPQALEKKGTLHQAAGQVSRRPDSIVFDNALSGFFSIIEVHTHDFPGLLYKITNALFQCGLDICFAKIGTRADQVVDVFYVRDFDGQKIDDPDQIALIKVFIEGVLKTGRPEKQG